MFQYKSNFLTCPLHALAIALATQDAPCSALLNQLPNLAPNEAAPVDSGAPLLELLEAEPASLQGAAELDMAYTAQVGNVFIISRCR
ncbi:hypothetical protein PC122_g23411 [Phytophthora cactorum]|nr:hypothetical protein PC122_g23411 [Phytophthora cactorum]